MKRLLHIFVASVMAGCICLLGGCTDRHATETITLAERLMEDHPDSSRMLLDGIDSLRLSKSQAALYAVLDAQSRHKLDMPVPSSDSLLNLAVERYTSRGPDSLLMKALFYRAVRHLEMNDLIKATDDATFGWEVAKAGGSHYWKAKIAEQIGDIYRNSLNMSEECVWRRVAMEEYHKAGKAGNSLFATCDLIAALLDLNDTDEALHLIDSIRPLVQAHPEVPTLNTYFYSYAVPAYAYYGNVEVAQILLDSLSEATHHNLPPGYQLYQARVYLRQGDVRQAIALLDTVSRNVTDPLESLLMENEYARCHAALGDYEQAYRFSDTVISKQNKVFHRAMANPTALMQRDLYRKWYNISRNRAEKEHMYIWIGIIGAMVVLVGIIVGIRALRKRAKKQFQREMEAVKTLREELLKERVITSGLRTQILRNMSETDIRMSDLQTELKGIRQRAELQIAGYEVLYRQKWDILNKICKEIYVDADSHDDDTRRVANLRRHMAALRTTDSFGELEKIINDHKNNAMVRLRRQCPFLEERDHVFLTLLLSGQSAKTVAFFTGVRLSYVYTKRDRLYARIMKSDAKDREEFGKLIKEA